jgi:AraC-like DNA-binding protein
MTYRLHRVRSALQTAEPETTVTAIAVEFGFWHFGRFAAAYRKLFGESPSATLYGKVEKEKPALAFSQ